MNNMTRRAPQIPPRLRILQIVTAYYPAVRYGGPIRSVHGLSAALVRCGHDVHVYTTTLDGSSDLDVPVDQPVDIDGVKVHYFPVPALRRIVWSPALGHRLQESVRDFDIVHTHGAFLWPMWMAARIAARNAVPYVVTPHGMLIREAVRRRSRWIKTAWINLIERKTLAQAAAVQVTARLEGEDLLAQRLARPQSLALIFNGLDSPSQHVPLAQTPYAGLPPRYALFLSRINWKKGLERLIAAWQHVPALPLVIAGNDEEGYQPKLVALAQSLGLGQRVLFIGPVSDAHKWALYEQAQVFMLPSYSENFGIVVAEAMAMGCPVVVTPDVGVAEHVQSAGAGIVVGNEPAELSAAVNTLLGNEPARLEMGRRGRELVREQFAWSGVVDQMEQLYLRISGRPAVSARPAELAGT
jgi:glycosyltransferase involved in cell wall biosynthesis